MSDINIPTLLFWENGNTWYGSYHSARFFIAPANGEAADESPLVTLEVELWPGPLQRALSQVTQTASFPLSEEGLAQMAAWLLSQAEQLDATGT